MQIKVYCFKLINKSLANKNLKMVLCFNTLWEESHGKTFPGHSHFPIQRKAGTWEGGLMRNLKITFCKEHIALTAGQVL